MVIACEEMLGCKSRRSMSAGPVTGLYYERARWYSPSLGTWISQDPAGFVNGANTYQFVMSSPVGRVDASGALYFSTGWQNRAIPVYLKVTGWMDTAWEPASKIQQALVRVATAAAGAAALPFVPGNPIWKAVAASVAGLKNCAKVQYRIQGASVRNWLGDFRETWYFPNIIEDDYVVKSFSPPLFEVVAAQRRYTDTFFGFSWTTGLGPVNPLVNPTLRVMTPLADWPPATSGTVYHP